MAKTLLPEIMEKSKEMYQDHDLKGLTWDDLVLVLESYKNMITLNTTLLEQQRKIYDTELKLVSQQEESKKNIEEIKKKFDTYVEVYQKNRTDWELKTMTEMSSLHNEHNTMSSKINLVYVALASVIVALIGLAITILSQYHIA
jgi:uncharacterized protein YjcR